MTDEARAVARQVLDTEPLYETREGSEVRIAGLVDAALAAARADERERWAVLAETQAHQRQGLDSYLDLRNLAAAIRAGGQEGA